ncbi:MAG: hypothetical protein IT270_16135 [Saprospiraceae bacterium]|nr:hypothetical protein [Saprospiraceae bacterium]MCC6413193.1 hypothetical protein [Saprospiraceae bacterium]
MNFKTLFGFAFVLLLAASCKEDPKSSPVAKTMGIEISKLESAKQSIVGYRERLPTLRTELNNLPESVKSDTASGFSEVMRYVDISDMKSEAMLAMYDRVIPQVTALQRSLNDGMVKPEQAQASYDSMFVSFKGYETGVEAVKTSIERITEDIKRLNAGVKK